LKKFSPLHRKLLAYLSDGACHSGNALGTLLNVSRTAIWKHITQLIELGLPILRIPKRGYQLMTPLQLLDEELIQQELSHLGFALPIEAHVFASIDSTNRFLKELPSTSAISVCCAEMQTEGRGRFGRQWYSPFGENIYFSSRWHFDCDLSRLSGLSLVVSLSILSTLKALGIEDNLRVKWPNDIFWDHQKLCGSLIEVIAESNSGADVVIGIGLNVNSNTKAADSSNNIEHNKLIPDKPWCSLHDIKGVRMDRNKIAARLLITLSHYLDVFLIKGFGAFISEWNEADYLKGHAVQVSHPRGALKGIANGVNEAGQLLLVDDNGVTHCLSSGDTSLHDMRNKE